MQNTHHVKIQDFHTEAEIVLVEYPFKLAVDKNAAFCEARSSPRIKGACLELSLISSDKISWNNPG